MLTEHQHRTMRELGAPQQQAQVHRLGELAANAFSYFELNDLDDQSSKEYWSSQYYYYVKPDTDAKVQFPDFWMYRYCARFRYLQVNFC